MAYVGSDDDIQRKVRRTYDYIAANSKLIQIIPEGELHILLKAIFIANDEEFEAAFIEAVATPSIIADPDSYDAGGAGPLDPIPHDLDALG